MIRRQRSTSSGRPVRRLFLWFRRRGHSAVGPRGRARPRRIRRRPPSPAPWPTCTWPSARRPERARRYRGRDAAERQAERRERLLRTGLELFGTVGYAGVSVKQVCQASGLTERYFYESFSDREDLLTSVYDEQIARLQEATIIALGEADETIEAQAHAGVDTFIRTLAGDPRVARVVFIEVVGVSPALELRRRTVMREFAQVIVGIAVQHFGRPANHRLTLASTLFVGGLSELMIDWIPGYSDVPADDGGVSAKDEGITVEQLVDLATTLLVFAFELLRDEPEDVGRDRPAEAGRDDPGPG
ncbi:TetR/AcrR family transcriptional regulator [Streptomyces sp. B1866]|uniref:TetR/AcrR family transcriptional regulator n=1 Tax=Streptomyces sp. B1866 TaxID=3075431 RepID=UPI00288D1ED0|nr:TetR/AcrR family transcriptional regulator [Streptomyces sp. B1866]MDT3398952.1 TetR/AcrR family transcriptional regulator [Streptomyces sp. B1866]